MSKRPSQDATPTESEARAQDPHHHIKSVTSSRPSPNLTNQKEGWEEGGKGKGEGSECDLQFNTLSTTPILSVFTY